MFPQTKYDIPSLPGSYLPYLVPNRPLDSETARDWYKKIAAILLNKNGRSGELHAWAAS
jgi:hypothetical protein